MIRVIRHHTPVGVLPLLLSDIVLLLGCFYAAAEILYPPSAWYYLFFEGGITLVAIAIATVVLAMYFFNMYAEVRVASRIVLLQELCQSFGVAIIVQTVAIYLFRDWTVPHLMMIYSAGFAIVVLFLWRIAFSLLIGHIGLHGKLLFVGQNSTAEAVARAVVENPKTGYRVIGFLDDYQPLEQVLGRVSALRKMVEEHKPNLLVVGLAERRTAMPVADLVALRFGGLQIEEASKTFENVYQRVCLPDLSEQQAMFSRAFVPSAGALSVARVLSTVLAVLFLLMFAPLFVFLIVWLKLASSEPVLLRLERAGVGGRPFSMLRFQRHASLHWLFNRFHLDALPELVNVVRGEMSLVGPRPEMLSTALQLSEALPFFAYRMAMPPGITGWAQINTNESNRSNQQLALEYDLYYIKNMSLALDLYILVHSLKNRILRP